MLAVIFYKFGFSAIYCYNLKKVLETIRFTGPSLHNELQLLAENNWLWIASMLAVLLPWFCLLWLGGAKNMSHVLQAKSFRSIWVSWTNSYIIFSCSVNLVNPIILITWLFYGTSHVKLLRVNSVACNMDCGLLSCICALQHDSYVFWKMIVVVSQ